MSKLLINEHPLQVLPTLAVKIGLNEAIMLQQIHYWINDRRCPNEREGRKWHYDTFEAWQEQFPFWSIRTIKTIAKNLKDKNLIITKAFNKLKGDKTMWYTVNYDEVYKLEIDLIPHSANVAPSSCKDGTTHSAEVAPCIYKEQRLRSETSTENNNNAVVVNELFENSNRAVTKQVLSKLLKTYTQKQINEKLSLFKHSSGIKNPGAWLTKALKENWQAPAANIQPQEKTKVTNHEVEAKQRDKATKQAIADLEARGIADPRMSGKPVNINVIRSYDERLTAEINYILNENQKVS